MSRSSMILILVPQSTNSVPWSSFLNVLFYSYRQHPGYNQYEISHSRFTAFVSMTMNSAYHASCIIFLDLNENFSAHLFQLGFERCLRQILAWSSVTGNNFRERRWRWLMLFYNIGSSILLQMQPIKNWNFLIQFGSKPHWNFSASVLVRKLLRECSSPLMGCSSVFAWIVISLQSFAYDFLLFLSSFWEKKTVDKQYGILSLLLNICLSVFHPILHFFFHLCIYK